MHAPFKRPTKMWACVNSRHFFVDNRPENRCTKGLFMGRYGGGGGGGGTFWRWKIFAAPQYHTLIYCLLILMKLIAELGRPWGGENPLTT